MSEPQPPGGGVNGARPARRRPRPWALAAIGAAAVLLLVALASLSLDEPAAGPEIEGAGAAQRLFGGIPQEGAELGSADAPVTIEVFDDLHCSECDRWHLETIPPLVEGLVRPREARLVYRHFPMGPRATVLASFGAAAAGRQGHQWQFAHLFFLNQDEIPAGRVEEDHLRLIAAAVLGLDVDRWGEDLDDAAIEATLQEDANLAVRRRLPAEPAVVVHGPGGSRELTESPALAEIEAAVRELG